MPIEDIDIDAIQQAVDNALPSDDTMPLAIPPAGGELTIPNINQFVAIINAFTKVYLNPDEAYRFSQENAKAMRRDLMVMQPLRSRQMAVAESGWHLEPENNKNDEQLEEAKVLTHIIEDTPDLLKMLLALLEAVFFGKAATQMKYGWDFSNDRKRFVVKAWEPVHGDSIRFFWRHEGEVGIMVNTIDHSPGTKQVAWTPTNEAKTHILTPWEREAFIVHKHECVAGTFFEAESQGSLHGLGLRHFLYWAWYQKHEILGWLTEYLEKVGLGITVYRFQGGNKQSEASVMKAVEAQANNCIQVWPAWTDQAHPYKDIERIEVNAANVQSLMRVIQDFYGNQIKQMILGQLLSSEVGQTQVGQGVADFQEDSLERIIKFDSINLAESLSRDFVSVLHRYNFPDSPHRSPKWKFNVEKPDPDTFLRSARAFYDMGGDIDADELRAVIGLSKPDKDSNVLRRVMTEGEMGVTGAIGNHIDEEEEKGKASPDGKGNTTKVEAIKAAVSSLGMNARASDIQAHLEGQGIRASRSLVYGTLQNLRGPTTEKRVGEKGI